MHFLNFFFIYINKLKLKDLDIVVIVNKLNLRTYTYFVVSERNCTHFSPSGMNITDLLYLCRIILLNYK